MANKYNITMKQYNGTDYDTLNPTTFPEPSVQAKYFNNPTGNETTNDALNLLSNAVLFTNSDDITFVEGAVGYSSGMNKIAYGNGMFIATPYSSGTTYINQYTKKSGWKQINISKTIPTNSLEYIGNRFVSIHSTYREGSYTFISTDGNTWTQGSLMSGTNTFENVAYGNGKYVACGKYNSSSTVYSADAISWNDGGQLPFSSGSSDSRWKVAFGNGKFVTIELNMSTGSNKAAYTTDCINWTPITLPSSQNWTAFAFVNDRFMLVQGVDSSYLYSIDGINWMSGTFPSSHGWHSILFGNGKYVIAASDSTYLYSIDGINWRTGTLKQVGYANSMAYGEKRFISIGNSFNFAYALNQIILTDIKGNVLGEVALS